MGKVNRFMDSHPAWNLRIYRTPAGLRLLAAYWRFYPSDPEVSGCFEALGSDPIYRMMCLKQQCFRARVSPKPWRIGLEKHLRPCPGVWPVKPEHPPARRQWISRYEDAGKGFSSCSDVEAKGTGTVDPSVAAVIEWHDELWRAKPGLPMAQGRLPGDSHEPCNVIEMRVAREDLQGMLAGEGGDPDVVVRDGATLALQVIRDPRIVGEGLRIGDTCARAFRQALK
jgi:hypothetical protein